MIYDDESARKLFLEAKSVYDDRDMMKWLNGFFLSDHTAAMKKMLPNDLRYLNKSRRWWVRNRKGTSTCSN